MVRDDVYEEGKVLEFKKDDNVTHLQHWSRLSLILMVVLLHRLMLNLEKLMSPLMC